MTTKRTGNDKDYGNGISNGMGKVRSLVILFEVHAGVQAGDLVAVAVEHQRGDGAGEKAGVDAALVGLGPAGDGRRWD